MIKSVRKTLFLILVLAVSFQCHTTDKKDKTSLPGSDRRIFVSGLGFVQGNVISIKSTLTSDNNARPDRITYILDHQAKTLTTIVDDKMDEKKIYS